MTTMGLGRSMGTFCKFCGSTERDIHALREHCRTHHIDEYLGVLHYLGEVDDREVWASKIAAEGMKGFGTGDHAKRK